MSEEVINLPFGFTKLEYLESTRGQYINTNYIPNNETGLYIEAHTTKSNNSVPMGSKESDGNRIYAARNTYNTLYGWNTYYDFGLGTTFTFQRYKATTNFLNSRTATFIINDEIKSTKNLAVLNYTPTQPFYIFGMNTNGALSTAPHIGKIYRAKISQGTEIVRDFVPCLDINGRPCMYDILGTGTIEENTYYNESDESEFFFALSEEAINLPYGYKQCLFLESTGTQYINTNYVATNNTGAYVKWSLSEIKNYSNILASVGISTDDTADSVFMLPHWDGVNNAYLGGFMSQTLGQLRLENQTVPKEYTVHKSYLNYYNDGEVYIDTTLMGSVVNVSENTENDLPLYLFGCNKLNSLSTNDSMIGRIYRATITEGEEVVMDLIPCLDDKGKPCMYDLISNSQTPFYNANAEGDDFKYVIKGKIPNNYKRLKYLESTGQQWIDTGIVTDGTYTIGIKYQPRVDTNGILLTSYLCGRSDHWNCPAPIPDEYGDSMIYYYGGTDTRYNDTPYTYARKRYRMQKSLNPDYVPANITDIIWKEGDSSITVNGLSTVMAAYTASTINTNNANNKTYWIFGVNTNLLPRLGAKIFEFRMQRGGLYVFYGVPVLDENGVPCMFDLVEGITYYNAGRGEFLYNKGIEGNYTKFGQLSVMGNRLGGGTDGLPPTYTRVNYLKSTGTQYIDTGIITDGTYTISARMALFKGNSDVFGRRSNKGEEDNVLPYGNSVLNVYDNTLNYVVVNYVGRARNRNPFDITQPHDYVVTEGSIPFELNGITQSMAYLNAWAINPANLDGISYYLFWSNSSQNTTRLQKTSASVYNFCMQNGEGKVVLDFVPCLDDTGRPCMFDRVSRKSFYNNGTGEFLYG